MVKSKYDHLIKEYIMCKSNIYSFKSGKSYKYYTNFSGLNHFVINESGSSIPFDGPMELDFVQEDRTSNRYWIYDYFYTKEEKREAIIDQTIN